MDVDQNDEAILVMLSCLVGILMIPLFFGWLLYDGYSTSLLLNPAVVSASNLTTSWVVTIDLGVWTTTGSGRVNIERVQAFLSHSASRHDDLVPSTQLFQITRPEMKHRNAYGIQLRAEDDGFNSSSRFEVSVQLWVRLVNRPWSNKYYFARFSCKPDWIRSLEAMRWLSHKENKCQVHLIKQSKLDQSWKAMNTTK
ncbi:hypothetical protein LINGRAHAP2_LOCUS13132 [Linum grandiflorum]